MFLTDSQWEQYERDGFLRLGRVLSDNELSALRERIDAIMLGTSPTNAAQLLMQLDSKDGAYENAGEQSLGWKGATLDYRKIQNLEFDPLFLEFLQKPVFEEVCAHVYGADTPIAAFRAMFMNKPAHQGTRLPWHQDRWSNLDRDPLITVWTALDPASRANGCVEIVPGSHHELLNPSHGSGFLTPEQAQATTQGNTQFLELEAGEAVLLHNWLLHASDVNRTDIPRRAFSVCYMDARTIASNGEQFSTVFDGETLVTA